MDDNSLDKQLSSLDLPEERYKADLELHDRSQAFSSELLKLALGGIAVIGFLLVNFPKSELQRGLNDSLVATLISVSVITFALSVGAALLQRFYASGAMFHHLQVLKLLLLNGTSAQSEAARNMSIRTTKFFQAHFLLRFAAFFLVVAAVFLSAAFTRMMLLHGT